METKPTRYGRPKLHTDEELLEEALKVADWIIMRHFTNKLWSRRHRLPSMTERGWKRGHAILEKAGVVMGKHFLINDYGIATKTFWNMREELKQQAREPGYNFEESVT